MKWFPGATKHGVLLDAAVDDHPRCRTCDGVCCRSFPTVELTWPEYETLRSLGAQRLEFSPTGHCRLVIEFGCEFQVDGRCSIYQHRPSVCRRFICHEDEPALHAGA